MSTTLSCLLHKFPLICVTSISEKANNEFQRFIFKMRMRLFA